ncbi:MAG: 50S rRNA methyltransferase [Verrucomicrobia bacterium]|nr:50S rRNA methyltransferase [Verrucomicrobiota bacterium]
MKELFISCLPGLEPVLGKELTELGYSFTEGFGGLYVPFIDMAQVYRLNLELRTASRVLLPLHSFRCRDKVDLYKGATKVEWERYFEKMPTFAIDPVVHHKNLINSLYCAQVVKDAICDRCNTTFGQRPSVDREAPEVSLHLFIFNEQATISFDTSGLPLHIRGYRLEAGKAPLRESLAAALLLLMGYTGEEYLLDPCCGSGTFLIEAALIASKTAPGLLRGRFGIFSHPEFSNKIWQQVRRDVESKRIGIAEGHIAGIEANPRVVEIAKTAAAKALLNREITIIEGDFRNVEAPFTPNFVIANPPYGVRLPGANDRLLYKELGDFLKRKTLKPARGAIFTGNLELAKCIGLHAKKRHVINNGGIDCRLLEYDLY